jgi:CheY-like chemotaxis protein
LPAAPMVAPMAATHASILVVDDSAVARAKLKKLFEGHGYIVATANDGLEALETIGKQRFNVILTDLEMPNMDGFELIAAVQGSIDTEDIPIIAITGNEDFSVRVHAIGGLYGLFKKPWNDRDLLKRVDSLATMRHPVSSGV